MTNDELAATLTTLVDRAAVLNGTKWRGDWTSTATYNARDLVSYAGGTFMSLVGSNTNTPPTTTTRWADITVYATEINNTIVDNPADVGGRFSVLAATMVGAIPTLTDFTACGSPIFPNGNPTAAFQSADAKLPGGAVTAANAKAAAISNSVVLVNVTGVSWAVGVYGKLAVSTAGHLNLLGLYGDTSIYGAATYSTADATKYIIYTFRPGPVERTAVSTLVCDGAAHYFVLAFNVGASRLSLLIDGVERAALTDISALHNADTYVGLYNTISGDAVSFLGGVGFTP